VAKTSTYAEGGGGTNFEYLVAAAYASGILTGRAARALGHVVDRITLQPDDCRAFDDFALDCETVSGITIRVSAQVRRRQPLIASDAKFRDLMTAARDEVTANAVEYEPTARPARRQLLLAVGASSPGLASMRQLTDLAHVHRRLDDFRSAVSAASNPIRERFQQVRDAAGADDVCAHRILRAFSIVAFDLDSPTSDDRRRVVHDLAELWLPTDRSRADDLFAQLVGHLQTIGPSGGSADVTDLLDALPSAPSATPERTRRHRLQAELRASRGRVIGSLRSLDVPDDVIHDVADVALAGPVPTVDDALTVVVGDIGVGKSTAIERLHVANVRAAIADRSAPVPVWLDALSLLSRPLRDVVEHQADGIGDPSSVGAAIVIDSLDEVSVTVESLARQVYALAEMWPSTTVTLATRPVHGSGEGHATYRVPPLTNDEADALLEALGHYGHAVRFAREGITEALRRPLFAVLYALAGGSVSSKAALVSNLARKTVADLTLRHAAAAETLSLIAVASVDSGGKPVPLSRLRLRTKDLGPVLSSRVVEIAHDTVRFQLALLTEWFAAEELLADDELAADILADVARAERWKYVLSHALDRAPVEDAERLFERIVEATPLLAGWLLEQLRPPLRFGQEPDGWVPADPLTAAETIRTSILKWRSVIGPAASRSSLFDDQHRLRPTAVATDPDDARMTVGWWRGLGPQPDASALPGDLHPLFNAGHDWLPLRTGRIERESLWSWLWTFEEVAQPLAKAVNSGAITAGIPLFFDELTWTYVSNVVERSALLNSAPVLVDEYADRIDMVRQRLGPYDVALISGRHRDWRLEEAVRLLSTLRERGITEVRNPWPASDQRGSWEWSWWSNDQLLERLHQTSVAALNGFEQMVHLAVPGLAKELTNYRLLPARIVGEVYPSTGGGWEDPTYGRWYLEPLTTGPNDATWTIVNDRNRYHHVDFDFDAYRDLIAQRRPGLIDSGSVKVYGDLLEVFSATPASRAARSLLHGDLTDHGWASGAFNLDSNDPVIPPAF
jgi:hypothetical protein